MSVHLVFFCVHFKTLLAVILTLIQIKVDGQLTGCTGDFLQLADDDTEVSFSDRELELDEPGDLSSLPWTERLGDGFLSPLPSSGRSASLAAQFRTERSGRDTPASVDSIPLEWDHDYDLSRGLESASRALREQQSEEGDFPQRPASALSGQCSFQEDDTLFVRYTPIERRLSLGTTTIQDCNTFLLPNDIPVICHHRPVL